MLTTKVRDRRAGQIVQIYHFGIPSNYYKLWYRLPNGYFKAFKQFTGEHISLYPDNYCHIIKGEIEGF